jgi:hypothetical protein
MLLSIFSFSLALLNSSNRGSMRCLKTGSEGSQIRGYYQTYTYAMLRLESSEQRCSHCSNLSSPLVSLNTPKGLNRTATRPDPMAEHNLSTVSSVNRHLLMIDPPYPSLRWFTTFQLPITTATATALTIAVMKLVKQIPISCMDLNSVTAGQHRVDCRLHKVVLGSRNVLTCHRLWGFE